MKKTRHLNICIVSVLLSLALSSVFAGALISEFKGENGINKVTLKWKARSEVNLKGYEVERSIDGTTFSKIGLVKPSESGSEAVSYSYVDRTVFKGATRTFHYRLKIIDMNGSFSYSKIVTVTPSVSGVRFTWGSIKAMFR